MTTERKKSRDTVKASTVGKQSPKEQMSSRGRRLVPNKLLSAIGDMLGGDGDSDDDMTSTSTTTTGRSKTARRLGH